MLQRYAAIARVIINLMLKAILVGGFVCGALDGLSAILLTKALSGSVTRIFQGIARGLTGDEAFHEGAKSVRLGVALHFLIAFGAAAVYCFGSRFLPILVERALLCGALYGIAVHLFMNCVVIPLSAIGPRRFAPRVFYSVLAIHIVVVGPSIALIAQRYLKAK
jgi:hypothetical protein